MVKASNFLEVPIEFNKAFKATPKVVINDTSGSGNANNITNCKVIVVSGSITTTGFTARFYNNTSSNVSSFVANWIAVYAE